MNLKSKVSKRSYSLMMKMNKIFNTNRAILFNKEDIVPLSSFYNLTSVDNKNNIVNFESFIGKKVLIVNTASNCGYTAQYDELQKLYDNYKDQLIIIGFPSNEFKEQEKGNDEQIAEFCKINFGISFPLMKKSFVKKDPHQNTVYKWLTDEDRNGWNDHQPDWNFSKYLINENGVLIYYFGPGVSPLGIEILSVIKN